jgi:metal-responsive CopG/Arc/MetJ family transcriptional regulator
MTNKSINITLPEEILQDLANCAQEGERSSFISACLKESFNNIRKEKLRQQLEAEYKDASTEDNKIHNEFEYSDIETVKYI